LSCCPTPVGKHGFLSSYDRIDNGTETEIQFLRRLLHTILYPPLDHFHKTACDVVQKKFIGEIFFLMVRGLENIYADEAAQAVPEIFKENIAAFGNKQVFDMVRVALDMLEDVAENRIRYTGSIVMVCREVMIHDAVDDMPEEFRAHGIQKVVFRLEVGVKSAPPDIRAVDDGLYGNA
jgi:hypothetical protein